MSTSCSVVVLVITVENVGGVVGMGGLVVLVGDGVVSGPGEGIVVGDGVVGEVQGSWQDLPSV